MFVSKFSTENWVGNQNQGRVESLQDWTNVEASIKDLDGHQKTLVTLETDGEAHMTIGGGTGKYVVYATFDNETFHYPVELSKPDLPESLVVGGQEGVYSSKLCIDLNTALKTAKTFAELGTLEKSVVWERDGIVEPV
jgi:Immunity protein Imm1